MDSLQQEQIRPAANHTSPRIAAFSFEGIIENVVRVVAASISSYASSRGAGARGIASGHAASVLLLVIENRCLSVFVEAEALVRIRGQIHLLMIKMNESRD
jgi:hypothetical protein